jgi:hypothetical protein
MTQIEGTLHEDQYIFFIISRSLVLRMRSIRISENQNTHFMFNNFFFFENLTVYEIMWKSMVEPDRLPMTV